MRQATTGLWPVLLFVGVAAVSAGQNPPASADAQKLEAAWELLRARNARDYAVATPNGINEGLYVEVGGIQQWITIRGEDRNNPVLILGVHIVKARPDLFYAFVGTGQVADPVQRLVGPLARGCTSRAYFASPLLLGSSAGLT